MPVPLATRALLTFSSMVLTWAARFGIAGLRPLAREMSLTQGCQAPSFKTWECQSPLKKCSVVVPINDTESVDFDICVDKGRSCNQLGVLDKEEWMPGLWSKFLAIKPHLDSTLANIIRDWQILQAAITEGDTFHGITRWVNELTCNRALVTKAYSSSKLVQRADWAVYRDSPWSGKKVLIVGAGPIGLRMAIEARLMGAMVVVAEQRNTFTRANVMKMWKIARFDLESIGLGEIPFMKNEATGSKANIALMQHALLRVALVLGAHILPDMSFTGLIAGTRGEWKATFGPDSYEETFDAILDASGTGAAVGSAKVCGPPVFNRISQEGFRGKKKKVAVTANWRRFKGDTDKRWAFGETEITAVGAKMWQDVAKVKAALKGEPRVLADDLVYFQSALSNYVVIAASVEELAVHGVFKDPTVSDINLLVHRGNVDYANLENVVRMISEDWQIPHDEDEGMLDGINKMSIFEFTNLQYCEDPETGTASMLRVLPSGCHSRSHPAPEDTPARQYALVLGDALWAPFWPEGTGMSRGILSVMHAAFILNSLWTHPSEAIDAVVSDAKKWAAVVVQSRSQSVERCDASKLKAYVEYGYAGNPPGRLEDMM